MHKTTAAMAAARAAARAAAARAAAARGVSGTSAGGAGGGTGGREGGGTGGRNVFLNLSANRGVSLAKIENIGKGKTPRSPDVRLTCSLLTHSPQPDVSGFWGRATPVPWLPRLSLHFLVRHRLTPHRLAPLQSTRRRRSARVPRPTRRPSLRPTPRRSPHRRARPTSIPTRRTRRLRPRTAALRFSPRRKGKSSASIRGSAHLFLPCSSPPVFVPPDTPWHTCGRVLHCWAGRGTRVWDLRFHARQCEAAPMGRQRTSTTQLRPNLVHFALFLAATTRTLENK